MRAAAWGRLRTELAAPRPRAAALHRRHAVPDRRRGRARRVLPGRGRRAAGRRPARPTCRRSSALAGADAGLVRAWWDGRAGGVLRRPLRPRARSPGSRCLAEPGDISPRAARPRPARRLLARAPAQRPAAEGPADAVPALDRRPDCPAVAALVLEVTRTYMEMRPRAAPRLRPREDLIGADGSCAMAMGYLPLDGVPDTVCMDFGPASVDGWLADLGARQRLEEGEEAAGRPDPPGGAGALVPARPGRPGRSRAPRCCATSGATSGRAARTSSRSSSRRCGASSAATPARSRPCAASAIATDAPRGPG